MKSFSFTATSENFEGGKVLVHATDGEKVAMVELTITKMVITYIEYTGSERIVPGEEYNDTYLPEKSTYNEETGEGRIAIKGIIKDFDGLFYSLNTNSKKTLTSVVIPEGVEEIQQDAFTGCYGLTVVEFPFTLKIIGDYAFNYTY